MLSYHFRSKGFAALAASALLVGIAGSPAVAVGGNRALDPGTKFYAPAPLKGALAQVSDLLSAHDKTDAAATRDMISTPQAVWFNGGTPAEVLRGVRTAVNKAVEAGSVPVLVAYNLPFRDCGQYSAGGALSTAAYLAWIDAFGQGIGDRQAVVILEPDGLGIIPYYNPYGSADGSNALEWCQPDLTGTGLTPETAMSERFHQLSDAVDRLEQQPNALVYLDGTHSGWLGVGDAAMRLADAGVRQAQGFFLDISNYQYSANLVQYGTWISKCLATASSPADFNGCPNQYWNGGPDGTAIASLLGPWTGVGLSSYGEWSDSSSNPALNTSGLNARYASATGTTHFVVDTSRNGVGPWQPPTGVYPDAQDWCNPPDRGTGLRPTADTGNALVDAYLWVKIPGASDGQCTRGTAGPEDPLRGMVDPPAGQWFPEMVLELVNHAQP